MTRSVVICGAGGHGRVIADIVARSASHTVLAGFLDDSRPLQGTAVAGHRVVGSITEGMDSVVDVSDLIIGIGDNNARKTLAERATSRGATFAIALHPSAQVGADVEIGQGTVVMANAVINTGARTGVHVIINTAATVDHDCEIGDFVHISPGVHLAGNVKVGQGAYIGIGACVIPGVRIGEWAVVGAGATVIDDVAPRSTVVGTPAKPVKR